VAYGNSLEQIGPITRTVRESALLLDCITNHDPRDATNVGNRGANYFTEVDDDIRRIRIGIPTEFFGPGTDERVKNKVWQAIEALESEGAQIDETRIDSLNYSLPAYYVIAMSEASSNLARFDGLRYGRQVSAGARNWSSLYTKDRSESFGPEVKRRIIMGTFALSAGYADEYYLKAQKVRTIIRREFEKTFKEFDALIGPTMPILPFKIGEKTTSPLAMYMTDIDTVPANIAGLPAMSVPCGFADSLPIGLQIMAPAFREDVIFRLGTMVEEKSGLRSR
jgi:aspartyl-tRNA(Asn)/glutamyl-tRNA(Gln) amidotransferase subunit A